MNPRELSVRKAKVDDLQKLSYNDYSYVVDSVAIGPFTGPRLSEFQNVEPYTKRYDLELSSMVQYLDRADVALLIAVDGSDTPVGHLAVSKYWNGYASIDDIAVDAQVRRGGCASKLVDAAVGWARETGLPGLRAETQHNNASACKFYERMGFKLAGYDAHLYDALPTDSAVKEQALFWYLHIPANDK